MVRIVGLRRACLPASEFFSCTYYSLHDVAQHRIFVLLILLFAAFEWAVQSARLKSSNAALVFPIVCALGGALLLTHAHDLSNVKEALLAELSHLPLALLAVVAAWAPGWKSASHRHETGLRLRSGPFALHS